MGPELARWMLSLGSVAAAVGFTLLGMGMSYVRPEDNLITIGLVLMIGGLAVAIVGGVLLRAVHEPNRTSR